MVKLTTKPPSKMLEGKNENGVRSLFKRWIMAFDRGQERVAIYCSMHGIVWYSRIKSSWMKVVFSILFLMLVCGVLYITAERVLILYSELSNESGSQKHKTFDQRHFPNLTICHPKFFNQKLVEGTPHDTNYFLTPLKE